MLFQVVSDNSSELLTSYYFAFLTIIFGSYILHELEHEQNPDHFSSLGDALWWSVVTFTTIGYGDKYPVTSGGQIIGSFFALLGTMLLALPAGIIATGLGLQVSNDSDWTHNLLIGKRGRKIKETGAST